MVKRIAIINREKCSPVKCNWLCVALCPVNRTGKECITKGEGGKARIDESLCNGCSICSHRCPFGAISVVNLPEALEKEPIHRYGENQFELFSLVTPVFGKVVGVVGKNAVGKSTAIKILAGVLKPNLGKIGKKASFKELIDYFKGTETQAFFEKVKGGKIKVAYKPQQVDLIPKRFKGKVKGLLEKVNKKRVKEIAKKLDLIEVLDRNLKDISGGELQRVAIAATVLKKADLYIFDEPTSHLDIKQRLKVSKFIKGLADEKTAVIVVEHDLIALDYMADLINIMYGKEGCYGIVSGLKHAKAGINIYLEGFLKAENIRFRDYGIKFEVKAPIEIKKENILTSWTVVEKKMDGFSLGVEEGSIYKKEIVGVVGENGIGKTTLMNILAGLIKPDKGKIVKKVKISYKPQYLETESNELVVDFLKKAVSKYNNQIIKPLGIAGLLTKQLNQLSGGEAQKVAIAKALSQECNLVLLDEPSAYLDVEQRLLLSKIIADIAGLREFSVIVVDHDLLFLDYLSERLLAFDGVPAKKGICRGPLSMENGMNALLEKVQITLRRDEVTGRPKINKPSSRLDRVQKRGGKYYYA